MSTIFWLSKAQMARLGPFILKSHGTSDVDDRRVPSGIIFFNRNGLSWRDGVGWARPRFEGQPDRGVRSALKGGVNA